MKFATRTGRLWSIAMSLALTAVLATSTTDARAAALDADVIAKISGASASTQSDGVVKIGWPRTDVAVTVDGVALPAAAGLGSWVGFAPMPNGAAMVMGDTVVFADEVDAAMDAAFAHGLDVTAIHNHFFHDTPAVYFMHIGGEGSVESLAGGVRAVWDAIRAVRAAHPQPAASFGGPAVTLGHVDADAIAKIVGQPATDTQGVAKVTIGRSGTMHGDFIMTGAEVRPVLVALRAAGVHVVALHSHMIGEAPNFFFAHFWAKGNPAELAKGLRTALDAQAAVGKS